MKIQMQILYVSLIIILFCSSAYATAQRPEMVFYEDKVYSLYSTLPLESFYKNRNDRPQFHIKPNAISTGHYRGYIGMWEIKDEKLYLLGIDGWIPEETEEWVMADLEILFGDRYIGGRVAAFWFTGELRLPYGQKVVNNRGYGDIYEWDIVIHIESGKVIGEETIDNRKNSQLNQAVKNDNPVDAQTFSDEDTDLIVKENYNGVNAFVTASLEGHIGVAELLLERGIDVNVKSSAYCGATALIEASMSGQMDIVKLLLEKGAEVNIKSDDGVTALMWASRYGHTEVVKILLEKGAKVNVKAIGYYFGEWTALTIAVEKNHKDIVQLLKNAGAK